MAPANSGGDAANAAGQDGVRLTVAGAAARLGVAASTLRTWERRYGLGPSARTVGRHRRYDAHDVARLEAMRRFTREGVAPADAAMLANGQEAGRSSAPVAEHSTEEALDPLSLAAAAVEADEERLRRMIARAVPGKEVARGWQTLIGPALELLEVPGRSDLPGRDPVWALGSTLLDHIRTLSYPDTAAEPVLVHADPKRMLQAHVLAAELALLAHPARVVRPNRDGGSCELTPRMCVDARLVVLLGPPAGADSLVGQIEEQCALFVISLTNAESDSGSDLTRFPSARTLPGAVHEIDALLRE